MKEDDFNKQVKDSLSKSVKQAIFGAAIDSGLSKEFADNVANYFQECYEKAEEKRIKESLFEKKELTIGKNEKSDVEKKPILESSLKQLPQKNDEIHLGREFIAGDGNFTSETISSFEINYFDGEETTSIWIEKGAGKNYLSRVWIKNRNWFGIYSTSMTVPFEHYLWVLLEKCNVFQWGCDNFSPALNCKLDHGSIRLFTNQSKRTFGWIKGKPGQWDECMGYFHQFIRENKRTSYELGCILDQITSRIFDGCGTIRDFCEKEAQHLSLINPNSIVYPDPNKAVKCPCCGGKTIDRSWETNLRRYCPKCQKNVCQSTPPPKGKTFGDIISSIIVEVRYTSFSLGRLSSIASTENRVKLLIINTDDKIDVSLMYNTNGEHGLEHLDAIDKESFNKLCETLFFKNYVYDWNRSYAYFTSNCCENLADHYGGEIRIKFKGPCAGRPDIESKWTDDRKPPYWDETIVAIEEMCGKGILSL